VAVEEMPLQALALAVVVLVVVEVLELHTDAVEVAAVESVVK